MKKIAIALLTILSIISVSCQIGLGAAVDTEPPALTIQNPPIDSVIRDDFAIVGTYSDDGKIESVVAQVERTDGSGYSETFTGVLNGKIKARTEGTYTIVIPAKTSKITDGSYQAIVTIKDETGRTTIRNTTFTIDNTPPVIVLQRPGTDINATLSNADTYGQLFTLEGLGADDNNIDHINVDVYGDKAKTDYKTTVTLNNVPPSISLDIAKYGDEAYKNIYGDVAPADFVPQQYYCSITAFDGAQRYPVDGSAQTAEDLIGNSTSDYYIYEEISNSVLKQAKVTDIYHILNGSFGLDSSRSSEIDTAAILDTLALKKKTVGSFVLDPKNNPTFSLAGKPSLLRGAEAECLKLDTDFTVPNNSDITIQAAIGLDNSPIVDDDTFKVYFQKAKFDIDNGKYIAEGEKIYPVINSENGKKKSGSNYQFTVHVESSTGGLEVEQAYLVGVDGVDENGQVFLPANNGYGFYLISTSSAPTLKDIIPTESTVYVKKDASLTISGIAKLTEGKPTVSIRYDENEWVSSGTLDETKLKLGTTNEYEFELEVSADKFNENAKNDQNKIESKEFALELLASNGGKSSSSYKTVMYDVDPPEVNELTITPEIKNTDNTKYVLNGVITVKALLEDAFTSVKRWKYTVEQDSDIKVESNWIESSKVEFNYDTTALANEKDAIIRIIAEDKAGNEQKEPIYCYIDQSTDKPTFDSQDGTSWETGILNPYYIKQNLKNIISGSIYSSITDDDSVAFVKFQVQSITAKQDNEFTDEQKVNPLYDGYTIDSTEIQNTIDSNTREALYIKTGKTTSVSHPMPTKSGFYLVTQTVYDKNFICANGTSPVENDEKNSSNTNYFTKESYVIKISGAGPQYSLRQNTTYVSPDNKTKDLDVTITIESGEKPYTIFRWKNDKYEQIKDNLTVETYTDTFKVNDIYSDDDTITVKYMVKDCNGETQKEVTYSKDSEKPAFTKPKIEPDTEQLSVYQKSDTKVYYLNNKEQKFTISGLVNDNIGVDEVKLVITNTKDTTKKIEKESSTANFDNIQFATDNNPWEEGATVKISVIDTAGNTSVEKDNITTLHIKFDTAAPVGIHEFDNNGKDLYFRFGDYDNDTVNDAKDRDVGGKYATTTYGKLNTQKIRGTFKDFKATVTNDYALNNNNEGDGSGVSIFYYKVFDHEPDQSELDTYKNEYKTNSNGYFSPLRTAETKRVYYNSDANNKEIKSSYKTTIADLEEGINYLVLIAVDNVGNAEVESVVYNGQTYHDYKINVDQTQPVIETNANDTKYTNGNADYNVTGTYVDPAAWVKTVDFTYGTYRHSATFTADSVENVRITAVAGHDNQSEFTSDDLKVKNYDYLTKGNHARIKITKITGNTYATTSSYHDVINTDSPETTGKIQFTPAIDATEAATATYKVEFGSGTWTATIPAATLQSYAGLTKTVSLTAVDNAINSITEPIVATIVVDRSAPVVSIGTLASVLDKTIPISGTIEENNGINSLTLTAVCESKIITKSYTDLVEFDKESKYKEDDFVIHEGKIYKCKADREKAEWVDEDFEDVGFSYNAGTKQWSTTIDTTELNATGLDKNCTFTMTAVDLAGNTGSSEKLVKINQDNDRPILTFTEWTMTPDTNNVFGCERSELKFTIEDYDGDIHPAKVMFQFTETSVTTPGENDWKSTSSTPTTEKPAKLTYNDNNGTYTLSSYEQGQKKLWFKIEDSKGTSFVSGASSALNSPKIKDKTENSTVYASALHLKIDTQSPTVKEIKYYYIPRKEGQNPTWKNIADIDSDIFGGSAESGKQSLKITLYAYDANEDDDGLDVKLSIPSVSGDDAGAVYSKTLTKLAEDDTLPTGISKRTISDDETGYTLALYSGELTIDSKYVTGIRKCTLTVTEGVNPYTNERKLNIDNDGPTFELQSPKSTKVIVGDVEVSGKINDNTGGIGVSDKVKYVIPTKAQSDAHASNSSNYDYDAIAWTEVASGLSLTLNIDTGTMTNTIGYPDKENFDAYKGYVNSTTNLYELPVWLCLSDQYGNVTHDTDSIKILYNADADTPIIEITDPVHDSGTNNSEYIVMGGKIKISGTASDGVDKIKNVYLKFDKNNAGTYDSSIVSPASLVDISGITGVTDDKAVRVIPKNNSMNINWSYELDVLGLDDETVVNVKAMAIDEKPLHSAWSAPLCIHVENTKPNIRIEGFRRYSTQISEASQAAANNYEIQKEYNKGMYFKTDDGYWYIYGEAYVKDGNEITEITSTDVSFSWNGTGDATNGFTWTANGHVNQKFLIPIAKNAEDGTWEATIDVKGKNGNEGKNENETTLSFIVDNTKPTYTETNSTTPETLGNIKLRKTRNNATDLYAADSTGSKTMKNDQGKATIAGGITESGSGFKRLAFYFTRGTTIYNVMESTSNTATLGGTGNSDPATATDASDNLPLKTLTGTVASETFTPDTATDITNNKNIRKGGLVKIGYEYRKITNVANDGVVTFEPACDEKHQGAGKSAAFVYALIVDSSNEEANADGTEKAGTGDGDGMFENYILSPCTWEANINSGNIPDGPIQIHCVVFDEAGNTKYGWTKTYVSNNPPRITSVMLGTDLNADNKYDLDTEFETYYKNTDHSKTTGVDKWDLDAYCSGSTTEYWTAKKNLVVIPEFVGGNGDIYYAYSKALGATGDKLNTAASVVRNTASKLVSKIATIIKSSDASTLTAGYELSGLVTESGNSTGALILVNDASKDSNNKGLDTVGSISTSEGDFENGNSSKPGINVYRFSFRDSTNGGTVADDTQWCVLNITMKQDLVDGTAPKGDITPFYWYKSDEGVITSSVVYETENGKKVAKGHIELEADLAEAKDSDDEEIFTDTSGEIDDNPKVSGKIKIEGTAYDETRLGSITLKFAGIEVTSTYSNSTGWSAVANLEITDDDGPTQNGHSISWAWTVDTSAVISDTVSADTDKEITIVVNDAASTANASTPGSAQTSNTKSKWSAVSAADKTAIVEGTKVYYSDVLCTKVITPVTGDSTIYYTDSTKKTVVADNDDVYTKVHTGFYKVDIVPYITKISTTLDSAYSSNASVFNRSALGAYPVRRGSTITITGFNLKNGNTAPTIKLNNTNSLVTVTSSSTTSISATVGDSAVSGDLDVYVGTVYSLNNKTAKTPGYNQEANGVNNDILTDVRALKVWSFTNVVTNDKNVRYPTMRVAKNTDQTVAFAYDSGAQSYKMYLSDTLTTDKDFVVDYSFSQWYDTGVAVDSNGKIYGVSQNGDSGGRGELSNGSRANSYFYAWNTKDYPDTVHYYRSSTSTNFYENAPDGVNYSAYSKGKKKRAIENAYNGSSFNSQRVVNPKIITGADGVYLVYYDSSSDQVRFRYGTVTGSEYDSGFTGALINHNNGNSGSAANYHVIAGKTSASTPTNNGTVKNNVGKAGEYVAIGLVPKAKAKEIDANVDADVAVIVWYDASSQKLMMSWNDTPTSNTDTSMAKWGTNTTEIDSNFSGWYVDMVVDPAGGIHIAYYGASNGDLKYAYVPNYKGTVETCTVDSYLSVGTNISIDVPTATEKVYKADGTTKVDRYVPRISYFMSSYTKTSNSVRTASLYKLGAGDKVVDGASGDKFTGYWEVMTVPTNEVPLDYTIGIGIKKNSSSKDSALLGYGTKNGLQTAALE